MNILIGEISSYKGIVIAKYLKKNYPYLYVLTYDYSETSKKIKSKYSDYYFNVINTSRVQYIENLAELCRNNNIDYFIPVHSNYIGEIIKNKSAFGKSLDYLGNINDYNRLHQKDELIESAKRIGVDVPVNYDSFSTANIPFVAKPKASSSAKGVEYFFSRKDLKSKNILNENYIFQEYIKGIGCGYSVYAKKGEIKVGYGHKRLAEFPVSGGSSVYRESFFDKRMYTIVEKILNEIQWTGFAMFEFKYTEDDRLVLIEVNPRVWGSINQGLQNGVNYFEPILGKGFPAKKKPEIKTYLTPHIYLSLFKYILKGKFQPSINFFKNVPYNRPDINIFDDPYGYLSVILRNIR